MAIEKNDDEWTLVVALPDPIEAIERLESARFEYECMLDYCLANHRDSVRTDFLQESLEELVHLATKYDVELDV